MALDAKLVADRVELLVGKSTSYFCNHCLVRNIGLVQYDRCFVAMVEEVKFLSSSSGSIPQLWVVEHPPVFTVGFSASPEHFSSLGMLYRKIPFVFADRGGQVTYHGPGQLVLYLLVDVRRLFSSSPRLFVSCIEEVLVVFFRSKGIDAHLRNGYPGIYVSDSKLVSLGFRFHKGWSYHGIAINVDMDLAPFSAINPCGDRGLRMTQLVDIKPNVTISDVPSAIIKALTDCLAKQGGYCGS
ncbi:MULTISPECIES: lipoyl(octanoyl) transferase LipB [Candidatus Ichthyocystis]|uniref:Octanoyltransferase n=1 Tax=Candidatus Ichthyocystis hellenicum TaxID=1561003 RepID=A0A0S4M016_9BURK|nr:MULTISPECIES: lipoyl(octanoyl) transferase LipB [Ichthyocystis]CUT17157.1 lipoyl(octanoyl) transferase [Candidatus Ichthyocystis hellenicum]